MEPRVNGEIKTSINAGKSWPIKVVELRGEKYTLCFSMYAYDMLNKECGINLFTDGVDMTNASPSSYVSLIWAGLITEMPQLTRADVARMIIPADLPQLIPVLMEAVQMSLPDDAPQKKREQKASQKL